MKTRRGPPEEKAQGRDFASRRQADREALPKSTLTILTYLPALKQSKGAPFACSYCCQEIHADNDFQRVSKREYAHGGCAWRVNDAFFARLDATIGEKAKAPARTTLGPS